MGSANQTPWILAVLGVTLLIIATLWSRRTRASGGDPTGGAAPNQAAITSVMQVIVSVVVLAAGLYVILSPRYTEEKKWGYGIVGSVVGYWVKG
jgi:hypothetical protein